jgi:hypothetical protein
MVIIKTHGPQHDFGQNRTIQTTIASEGMNHMMILFDLDKYSVDQKIVTTAIDINKVWKNVFIIDFRMVTAYLSLPMLHINLLTLTYYLQNHLRKCVMDKL